MPELQLTTNPNVSLQKSLSFIQSSITKRHEFHGLNTTATLDVEIRFKLTATTNTIIAIQSDDSGATFSINETYTLTAGQVMDDLIITGTTTIVASNYMLTGLKALCSGVGSYTLKEISFTINNQF